MMIYSVLSVGLLISNVYSDLAAVQTATQNAVNAGADRDLLLAFIDDADFYVNNDTSDLSTLSKNSLLASNIMNLIPDDLAYYNTWFNTKLVMVLERVFNGDVRDFLRDAIEIIFPQNELSGTGAQELIDVLIYNDTDTINMWEQQYNNFNDGQDVANLILDKLDASIGIRDAVSYAINNDRLSYLDPDTYFKTLFSALLSEFDLPVSLDDFIQFVIDEVPIVNNTDQLNDVIRAFVGSEYVPERLDDELTFIADNWEDFQVFPVGLIIVLAWEYNEPDLTDFFANNELGMNFQPNYEFVRKFISDYLFDDLAIWLYLNDTQVSLPYIREKIFSYVAQTDIDQGWVDFYRILTKYIDYDPPFDKITDELKAFLDDNEIFSKGFSDALNAAIYDNETNPNPEYNFVTKFSAYVEQFKNQISAQSYNFWQTTAVANNYTFDDLLNSRYTTNCYYDPVYDSWNCYEYLVRYAVYNTSGEISKFIKLLVELAGADTTTFGDFSRDTYPNNLITNAELIADGIGYIETDFTMFARNIYTAITDMYSIPYPLNEFLNITAVVMPIVFDNYTWIENYPEQFVSRVLTIALENLDETMNAKDLVDITQMYLEMNKFNDTTFDIIVNYICEQSQDIAQTLCTSLTMINNTINVFENYNNIYPQNITDVLYVPDFLPFVSDLVDALVGTLDLDLSNKIVNGIDAMYEYFTNAVNSTYIVNLVDNVASLYLPDDNSIETRWTKTIDFVNIVLDNIAALKDEDIIISVPTVSPTLRPTDRTSDPTKQPTTGTLAPFPASANTIYVKAIIYFVFAISFFLF